MTRRAHGRSLVAAILLLSSSMALAQPDAKSEPTAPTDPIAKYFAELEALKLVDVESGNLPALRVELQNAENLLKDGAFAPAAVALFAIVKSPRFTAFADFVEFQNAEYDLAVALGEPIPASAAGERAYLRGRAAYDQQKFADAEGELVTISKKSRMYSSAVYLRGVIRARRGEYAGSAEAMCEVAGTPDNDRLTFVVDDRYFTIKDLARLGLGRLAHEQGEYDDAYYHYFQIPDDSAYLPDALFEASWAMYQKRELATSRDLTAEFLKTFPTSPMWPEASLLAGYVELADCKFDDSQRWYDKLAARLQPIVDEMDKIRKDPELRRALFARAVTRFKEVKQTGEVVGKPASGEPAKAPFDEVLALLRLDPKFVRLSDAVTGMHELAGNAPNVVRAWQNLGAQVSEKRVAAVSTTKSYEEEQLADANAVVEDLRRLAAQVGDQRTQIAQARHAGTIEAAAAAEELARLDELAKKTGAAIARAVATADTAAGAETAQAAPAIRPMITADVDAARRLDKRAHALEAQLLVAGEQLAGQMMDTLYTETRRVLDKAKLGKVDAVIGQKRKLDIEVQDLAAGRFPEELIGKLWNAGMIADDEELWPYEGEYWADEYEGWR
ncbi:MAG: hypothetical protein NT062_11045 [Proteobacteria bacterium]|nr:hypothetical protein [Pseudomonadota bacterium]